MKTMKIFLLALFASASVFTAKADDDRPIAIDQLPAKAQQFIQTHFKDLEVSYATVDRDYFDKSYEVRFVNGTKVEFHADGQWDNVDCHKEAVPAGIVPAQIVEYVKNNHPDHIIVEIDKDRRGYEINLRNNANPRNEIEIKFNRNFQVIGYDD